MAKDFYSITHAFYRSPSKVCITSETLSVSCLYVVNITFINKEVKIIKVKISFEKKEKLKVSYFVVMFNGHTYCIDDDDKHDAVRSCRTFC